MVAVFVERLQQLLADNINRPLIVVRLVDFVHTATVPYTVEHHKAVGMLHNFQLQPIALSQQPFVVSILFCDLQIKKQKESI